MRGKSNHSVDPVELHEALRMYLPIQNEAVLCQLPWLEQIGLRSNVYNVMNVTNAIPMYKKRL